MTLVSMLKGWFFVFTTACLLAALLLWEQRNLERIESQLSQKQGIEVQLKDSLIKFESLFRASPDFILITELESGRIVEANDRFCDVYRGREKVIGATVLQLGLWVEPSERDHFLELLRSCGGEVQNFEMKSSFGDGTVHPMLLSAYSLDISGLPCLLTSARDVTDFKKNEEKLREQSALLDIADDAIYVRTMERTIQFWNRGAECVYGWSADEVMGKQISELFARDTSMDTLIAEQLLKTGAWVGERLHCTKDGRWVTVLARLRLVRDERGQPKAVLSINTDITERKKLETQWLRSQRLESLGALAGGIAHDLNNVLAPILLAVPLIKAEVRGEEALSLVETVEKSAQRGAGVVRQVLAFARGAPGEKQPMRLQPVLRDMVKIARETFPKNIRIHCVEEENLWTLVGDSTQLHQVLMNLFVNARDAMPEGGKLVVTAENSPVGKAAEHNPDCLATEAHVLVRVQDSGCGIPEELQDKIFEPFFTTKEKAQGTGLGLSTVLGILKSHRASLQLASVLGKGTTFSLFFPAIPEANPERSPEEAPVTLGKGETILLVEDESHIRETCRRLLERAGYIVLEAAEGTEGVGLFVQNRAKVSAVITDLMMPGMDGLALVRVLRRLDPRLPLIACSGAGERQLRRAIEQEQVNAYLEKPFSREQLLAALHEVLPRLQSER